MSDDNEMESKPFNVKVGPEGGLVGFLEIKRADGTIQKVKMQSKSYDIGENHGSTSTSNDGTELDR